MAKINDIEYQKAKQKFMDMGYPEKEAAFNAAVAIGDLEGDILDEQDDRFTDRQPDGQPDRAT